ncbi:MAG: AbrB/MazE/SpoVT family DNA-binding domain-containing protein [Thermoplasmatales archaeon]|jgi:AbrB family looped-hinge helix DNA binding protein|nr:AbrB/MazE/SpoVT family DNA-binding domain-containing protein [Thermoplasmatales archaeon]
MSIESKLIEVTRTSKRGSSLRVTLPKEIAESLSIGEGEFLGFYLENNGIVIRKLE